MLKLLATQYQNKSVDKVSLLRGIKNLLLNQSQQQKNQVQMSDVSVATPEQVERKDMNESKKPLETNQDQKKSFNQMSTSAAENNCEMTDTSNKDQVSPF
jgi:hypothetical protein